MVFVDSGTYRVTDTIHIPAGSRVVGESYPIIISSGQRFAKMKDPAAVVQVGKQDEDGKVGLSDFVVATQGSQPGAVLIEWNLGSSDQPSGVWGVHTRIGGFAGSTLQIMDCPATPSDQIATSNSATMTSMNGTAMSASPLYSNSSAPYRNGSGQLHGNSTDITESCLAAFMSTHITKSASGLYFGNNWL